MKWEASVYSVETSSWSQLIRQQVLHWIPLNTQWMEIWFQSNTMVSNALSQNCSQTTWQIILLLLTYNYLVNGTWIQNYFNLPQKNLNASLFIQCSKCKNLNACSKSTFLSDSVQSKKIRCILRFLQLFFFAYSHSHNVRKMSRTFLTHLEFLHSFSQI